MSLQSIGWPSQAFEKSIDFYWKGNLFRKISHDQIHASTVRMHHHTSHNYLWGKSLIFIILK